MDVPQIFLCECKVSLLHIFGPENLTQWQTGDTCTAGIALGYVLGVGETEQTFCCQPHGVELGRTAGLRTFVRCGPEGGFRGDVVYVRATVPLRKVYGCVAGYDADRELYVLIRVRSCFRPTN